MASVEGPGALNVRSLSFELSGISKWYQLGIKLGLQPFQLHQIEQEVPTDIDRRKIEVVDLWLRNTPGALWEHVVTALREMGDHTTAERIELKYVKGARDVVSTPQRVVSSPPPSSTLRDSTTDDTLIDKDFFNITNYLIGMEKTHVYHLGVVLGLNHTKLRAKMEDSKTFLDDVISAWLRKEDQVIERGEPSWRVLISALQNHRVGQTGIASDIAKDKGL